MIEDALGHPAIDDERGGGHVARLVRQQEQDAADHVLDLADAPERGQFLAAAADRRVLQIGGERRLDVAGREVLTRMPLRAHSIAK